MATEYQTPYDPPFDVPDTAGVGVGTRGGFDMGEGSEKETPWAIGQTVTTHDLGAGDPGVGGTIPSGFEGVPSQRRD